MNQREMKRFAWWVSSIALQGLLDVGWPFEMQDNGIATWGDLVLEDKDGNLTPDGERLDKSLREVIKHMQSLGHR